MVLKKVFSPSPALNPMNAMVLRQYLTYVVFVTVLIILISLALVYQQVLASPARTALTVFALLVNILTLLLLRSGNLRLAGRLLVFGYWASASGVILISGGLHSPWLPLQLSISLLAGLIIGGYGGVVFIGFSLLLDIVLYILHLRDLISTQSFNPGFFDYWLSIITNFAFVLISILGSAFFWQRSVRESAENANRSRSLFNKTSDAVFIVDRSGTILEANQQAVDLLGFSLEQLQGKMYALLLPADEREAAQRNFEQLRVEGSAPLFERTMLRHDGSRVYTEISSSAVKDQDGNLLYYMALVRDISERRRLEQELRVSLDEMKDRAMKDPLTGLLNRGAITEIAEVERSRAQREQKPLSLLLIDLDKLKGINDSYGHLAGDQVLTELAKVINESKRRTDWIGRWGGDEFLLVLPGANLTEAQEVGVRIQTIFALTKPVASIQGSPKISIGIACLSERMEDQTNLDTLFEQADDALYKAKELGGNRVEIYRDSGEIRPTWVEGKSKR